MTKGVPNPVPSRAGSSKETPAPVTIYHPVTGETMTIDSGNAHDRVQHLGWRFGAAPTKAAEAPQ